MASPRQAAPIAEGPARPGPDWTTGERQRLALEIKGRTWLIERTADLETLWEGIGQDDFGDDERIPYWAELWPASLLLADWLTERAEEIRGRRCLDVGCGLGPTAVIAASLGARVVGFDYEWPAVFFGKENAALNGLTPDRAPLFVQTDWRTPGLRAGGFDFIWGGDIVYERRFFEPLAALFTNQLAPDGRIWLGEPVRSVSQPAWTELARRGWLVRRIAQRPVPVEGYSVTVNLWELRRDASGAGRLVL